MYIMDEIRYLYESSVPGSTDYAISEYLLTHLDAIENSTLTVTIHRNNNKVN